MIGEKLQRYHLENRQQQLGGGRNVDHVVRELPDFFGVLLAHYRDHNPAARLHFLNVRKRLLKANAALFAVGIARGQHHYRKILVDERVGAVLHLSGRITLSVNVRDFLQLQRAFERDREVHAAAEEQKISCAKQALHQLVIDGVVTENRL